MTKARNAGRWSSSLLRFSFDGKMFTDFRIGPRLGEHTAEILKSLGYTGDEIQKLDEKQIVIASRKR